MKLPKYSLGVGDRFGHQAPAQLAAVTRARAEGIEVAPVWNKSHREHGIIGTKPADVRRASAAAVQAAGYTGPYYVDADHIHRANVADFLDCCDFFTIDVADAIGSPPEAEVRRAFLDRCRPFVGSLTLPNGDAPLPVTPADLDTVADTYLGAVQEAGRIYRHIAAARDTSPFVTEVSMDETDRPQSPVELFLIMAALADEGVPVQTLAPRFPGRFNKGVDYVGDPARFEAEFRADVGVLARAVESFDLPPTLKLSLHSGSDKFSIYGPIRRVLHDTGAGLHIKTAGTTWLEELIGLAEAGGDGLALAQEVYAQAYAKRDALCVPYASVIDIDAGRLPRPDDVAGWDSDHFARSLRHDPRESAYNPHLRQLLHVGYKIAADMGSRYSHALEEHREVIARQVTTNILVRHLRPVFGGERPPRS